MQTAAGFLVFAGSLREPTVAGRASRCLTVLAAPGQHSSRRPGTALGQARDIGAGHETIGVDRARLAALSLLAAIATSHVDAAGPHGRRLGPNASRSIYLSQSRSVVRKTVKVWDPHPEKNLDFVWEPATGTDPGIAADGTSTARASWSGGCADRRATIRRPSTASIAGEMRDGRPNGQGRLEIRSGEVFEGDLVEWPPRRARASISTPTATATRACSRPASPMAMGACSPAPARSSTGEFRDGLKHGKGKTRLAGGTTYESQWDTGKEIGATGPTCSPTRRSAGCSRRSQAAAMPARSRSASSSTSA